MWYVVIVVCEWTWKGKIFEGDELVMMELTMLQRSVPLEQSGSFRRRIPSRYHLTCGALVVIVVIIVVAGAAVIVIIIHI